MRRARDVDSKAARRDAILRAAERLFADADDALPTVSEVAAGAGLAKGTVYLYFASQAEIFLTLLLEGWTVVLALVAAAARGEFAAGPGRIVTALADALCERPGLLRLDAFGAAILERQSHPDALQAFKAALAARIADTARSVEEALDLPMGGGERLLINTYSFARGLWQTSGTGDPSPLTHDDPARKLLRPDFKTELERALLAYWRGEMGRPPVHGRTLDRRDPHDERR